MSSSNVLIRSETEADLENIDSVVGAAFRRPVVVDLLHALRSSNAWRHSFVAVREQQVIGHVAYTRGWVDASLRSLDAPLVFLEGDPAFYSRLGFVAAGPLGFIRPSARIPEPGFQVKRLR